MLSQGSCLRHRHLEMGPDVFDGHIGDRQGKRCSSAGEVCHLATLVIFGYVPLFLSLHIVCEYELAPTTHCPN